MLRNFFVYAFYFTGATIVLLALVGFWFNFSDKKQLDAVNDQIWKWQDGARGVYDPSMIAGLPPAVQSYFNFMIAPGADLKVVSRMEMVGDFGLGDVHKHTYYKFTATQYNAPPTGFTWSLKTYDTAMLMNGSDVFWNASANTRFWLLGLFPVVRAGGDANYQRSGFGRLVIEMAAWSPVSLLPQFGVEWEQISPNVIQATVNAHGLTQAVDITVDQRGAPTKFQIQRWSNANAAQEFKLQPFGGIAHGYKTFDGITIVSDVEVGNHIGTPDYFAFFKAQVTEFEFQ
ncbi:DUF6544 family protein [Maritalea sp.]|uniref:DUF6544 family protein n=1 Tax=Maritalea sp. TaxID=2003361 RepID=UPI003EFA3773